MPIKETYKDFLVKTFLEDLNSLDDGTTTKKERIETYKKLINIALYKMIEELEK